MKRVRARLPNNLVALAKRERCAHEWRQDLPRHTIRRCTRCGRYQRMTPSGWVLVPRGQQP